MAGHRERIEAGECARERIGRIAGELKELGPELPAPPAEGFFSVDVQISDREAVELASGRGRPRPS